MNLFSKNAKNYTNDISFDIKIIEVGHHKMLYKNVPIIKCAFDYVLYQMMIFDLKPELVIEIGTSKRGSSLYFADLLEIMGKGEINTIDIIDVRDENAKNHPRIKFFGNGFQNYDLKNTEPFECILIIDDSSHLYEDVKAAMVF
jgi:cephalosporin hydroxylase